LRITPSTAFGDRHRQIPRHPSRNQNESRFSRIFNAQTRAVVWVLRDADSHGLKNPSHAAKAPSYHIDEVSIMSAMLHHLRYQTAVSPWVIGPVVFVLWIVILPYAKRRFLSALKTRLAGHRTLVWADALIDAMSPALTVGIWIAGLALLASIMPLPPGAERVIGVIVAAGVAVAIVIFVDRIAHQLLLHLALRSEGLYGAFNLVEGVVRGIIIGVGVLMFLQSIGIAITPILASLGIGSLAVALALQETLANLFAGVYMLAEKPIAPGNFIKLEGGEQGYVLKVGWRSTQLRMLSNSVVVVPNSKMAGNVITNFSLPRDELAVNIEVGVSYESDLEKVQEVTLELAREVAGSVEGALTEPRPMLRFHALGDSSINLTVWIGARDFVSGMAVKHEFIKRLHARYRSEGIGIPFPIRTLDLPSDTLTRLGEIFGNHREAAFRNSTGDSKTDA
jgi:small-conductance mechanosensitive channel